MILYVNGDSHTAAAEAANPHAWAMDDGELYHLGQRPHPANLAVSWGNNLARKLHAEFYCDAQAGCSNARIMRTTRQWIRDNYDKLDRTLMIIQWSTWEREEWQYHGEWWQVNASGADQVHPDLEQRYKEYVANVNWTDVQNTAHNEIYIFHRELEAKGIRHVFFNGNSDFSTQPNPHNWNNCYIGPYNEEQTYNKVLRNNRFATVSPHSWHFGPDAHSFWARYMLQYLRDHNFLNFENALFAN